MKGREYLHCLAQIFSFSLLDVKVSGKFMEITEKDTDVGGKRVRARE